MLTVKGNQGGLRMNCEQWLFDATVAGEADAFETAEQGHGQVETRKYWSALVPEGAVRRALWAGLTSIGMVESTRTVGGVTTTAQRYFASSLAVDAEALARAIRGHWGVENGLHWTLDVAFREDESRSRVGHVAANLAVVRHASATLLKEEPTGKGGVQTRMRVAWDEKYRERVLRL